MLIFDKICLEIQKRLDDQLALVVGTGHSMSIDPNFGLSSLENHLSETIPLLIYNDIQAKDEWQKVNDQRLIGIDFENSLNKVQSELLLASIIKETGSHVTSISLKNLEKIHNSEIPIIKLLEKLKNKLCTSHPTFDIITPNYDLILEYALAVTGISYTDGFWGEYIMCHNWLEAKNCLKRLYEVKGKTYQILKPSVFLHKIHGSLNYFKDNQGQINRIDSLSYIKEQCSYERFIITPGMSKFKKVTENRKLYEMADKSIRNAQSYLFIGYGFNDSDIDKDLLENINNNDKNAVIVTKEIISEKGMTLFQNKNNIIIEDNKYGGALIHYQGKTLNWKDPLWKIDLFADNIL